MDPDYIAFRELVRQAEHDPALAAVLTHAMRDALPLASSAGVPEGNAPENP